MMPTMVLPARDVGIVPVREAIGASRVALMQIATDLTEEERKARIAYVIESTRRRRKMSPPQLAELVGRSRGTVNDWEAGRSTPSLVDLGPLCIALGLKPEAFAELPAIPADPLAEYLLPAAESAVEEGLRRARRPRVVPDPEPPSPSRKRPPRGSGAGRG